MNSDKSNLFLTLLKLKSYLVSMIDERKDEFDNFNLTSEYLERRFPEKKREIITILEDNGIYSDSEIAFNDKIILQFRAIANRAKSNRDLMSLLKELEIEAKDISGVDSSRLSYISEREKKVTKILDLLFQLATNWAVLKELEDKVDDYSVLDEEEVIRPEEEKSLSYLDNNASQAFNLITDLTKKYINDLIDYYFTFGGDLALKDFVDSLNDLGASVNKKYSDLFKRFGFDPEKP